MNKKKGKFKWTMLHYIMLRRSMGILLVVVMVFSTLPVSSFAVFASENRNAGLCEHHTEHDADCGFVPKSEDGEGSPCTYECRICPVEDLIADLPDKVTEDNAEDVRAQLDEILALYGELSEDEQGQIDLFRCYELQAALDGANAPDPVTESVEYQEASWNDGVTYTTKTADNCTPVADSADAVTWDAGWYVVNSTITITEPITVTGTVNLILADSCTLNAEKGIVVTTGNSLTIYAQSGGTGTLNATGVFFHDETTHVVNASAGIGGSGTAPDSGAITIHGGVINATGGGQSGYYGGAGIGGGTSSSGNGGSSGAVIVFGGTVTANSGAGNITGAGIGGGGGSNNGNGGAGSNITIYGGNVTTSNGGSGAGIGGGGGTTCGGTGSNIQICGGGGYYSSFTWGSTTYSSGCTGGTGSVTITGGIVDAKGGEGNSRGNYAGDPIGNGGNAGDTAATVNKTTGIVFENGVGTVYGTVTLAELFTVPDGYSLTFAERGGFEGNYAFYQNGSPIELEAVKSNGVTGPATVQECQHKDVTPTSNNDGTHTLTCPYCGYTKTAEDCDYGEYTHNDTSHTRICKLCGYQNVKEHNIKCTAEASGTVIAVSEACKTCGYGKDLGTVTIHIPKLVYGDLTGVVTAETTLTEPVNVAGNVKNSGGETTIFSVHAIIDPPTMATLTGDALLSAGEHKIKINIVIIRDENALAECELTFNVDPAPLTADMVTLSAESTTYSGIEQKPTVTVAGLTEGTDYAVSYTRDGTITTDFTSAGTVTITITGTGNYQGEVVKTFTIKKAKPSLSVGKAEITYGEALYESALTAKAQDDSKKEIVGTFTWKDRFVKPAVSDSGKTKYTLVFTPKDEKNYDSVETGVTLTVKKAENPPKKPGSTMNVSVNCSKVGDIVLPEGWKWQERNTALSAGVTVTATAEYTGADSENYEKTTAEVEIIRSNCSHVPGEFLYKNEGEKEPTCTKEGLGHRECTVCGAVIESEAAVPALGHDYTETVTKAPTTEQEGVKTYTCSRCHDTYTESIPKLTGGGSAGGGSAGGGASAGGNGTVVTPEVPDTFTETVTKTNSAGKTVVVTTTIKYGSNQSIISKTVKSVIEQAAVNTAVTVTVKTDKNGKTTASATVVKTKTAAEKETKNTISAAVVSQIIEAAGTADVMITWKVKDAGGKTKYTIKVNAKDVKNGSVLKIMKIDPKTGEYILVNAKNYPVTKNGNVSVTVDKKGTYILLSEADAKKYSDAIKKSIKVKEASKSIKAGQKTTIALNGKTNKDNIKKITYTSTDKSIASVDKKGRITAKKKGTVTIKAKVTLKNGVTKTVKMKVKVK